MWHMAHRRSARARPRSMSSSAAIVGSGAATMEIEIASVISSRVPLRETCEDRGARARGASRNRLPGRFRSSRALQDPQPRLGAIARTITGEHPPASAPACVLPGLRGEPGLHRRVLGPARGCRMPGAPNCGSPDLPNLQCGHSLASAGPAPVPLWRNVDPGQLAARGPSYRRAYAGPARQASLPRALDSTEPRRLSNGGSRTDSTPSAPVPTGSSGDLHAA